MKLNSVQVFVENLAQAKHFYGRVLKLRAAKDQNLPDSLVYTVGAAKLIVTLTSARSPGAALIGRFTGITLAVANLAALYRRTESQGMLFTAAPHTIASGAVVATIQDPSHNLITLVQNMRAPSLRSQRPKP